jgi:membrane-bound serine protease (ClpP class)
MQNPLALAAILILAGLFLLLAELFIPSGIFFVLSVCAIVAGVVITFLNSNDAYTGWLTLLGVFVVVPAVVGVLFHYWPKTPMGRRFFLQAAPDEADTLASMPGNLELEDLRGRFGQALSALRPAGVVDFDGRRVDTVTEGMMVEEGQWVRCIDVKSGRVIVRPVDKPPRLEDLENLDFR